MDATWNGPAYYNIITGSFIQIPFPEEYQNVNLVTSMGINDSNSVPWNVERMEKINCPHCGKFSMTSPDIKRMRHKE